MKCVTVNNVNSNLRGMTFTVIGRNQLAGMTRYDMIEKIKTAKNDCRRVFCTKREEYKAAEGKAGGVHSEQGETDSCCGDYQQ